MSPIRTLRRALRPIAGRDRTIWRVLRAPRLRYALFRDVIDCVIYGLLLSRPHVRFIQIGSNDGRTGDPLWTFRRYRNWSGIVVEPVDYVFRRLARNYARWPGRFTLENVAVACESGSRPFHYFQESDDLKAGYHQVGSLNPDLLKTHLTWFTGAEHRIVSEPVRCVTFTELCEKNDVTAVDLLHVDAEGSDGEILEQVNRTRIRPAVVLYEHVHLTDADRATTSARLHAAEYETMTVGPDTLAVRREALESMPPLRTAWRCVVARADPVRVSGPGPSARGLPAPPPDALPRVSVILPTWDRLPLLRKAIDSVRAQTFEDWELIVVDDGSTDATHAYVTGLGDDRIRLVALSHGGNVARARNAGARAATADHLAFLDSDDVWLPRKLEIQLERMLGAGERWSYTRYDHIDAAGNAIPARAGEWREMSGRIAHEIITCEASVSITTVMVERGFFFDAGGFDEKAGPIFREDFDLELRLALLDDVIAIGDCLTRVREHAGRTSGGMAAGAPFLATARVYDKFLRQRGEGRLRRAAKRRRAWHLAEAGAHCLRAGQRREAAKLFARSLADRPLNRQWVSAVARGLGVRSWEALPPT